METTTDDLPFLVVHGAHVWKALLIASVAAVCGACWLVRWGVARWRTRAGLADLSGRAPGEGETVLRGTLGGAGGGTLAATLRARRYKEEREAVASWRAGELWIETGDGRVFLDGDVDVVAGSRAAVTRNGVPAAVDDAHLEAACAEAPWLHRVRPFQLSQMDSASLATVGRGDRVVVRGRLDRRPGASPAGYRDGDVAWVLRAEDARPLALAACAPRTPVLRMARDLLVLVVTCTGLISWGILTSIGDSALVRCGETSPREVASAPLELPGTHACAIAAAMPGSRDDALGALSSLLERDPYRDERSVRRLLGASALHAGCQRTGELLLRHARLEDAARHARGCGDTRTEYAALVAQGKLEAAADLYDPGLPSQGMPGLPLASTLIVAGRWSQAARAVDGRAAELEMERDVDGPSWGLRYRCLAELLRAFGGDREAPRRLQALDDREPGTCAAMRAELAPPEERRRLLEIPTGSSGVRRMQWASGLSTFPWESDAAEELLADPARSTYDASLAWLVASERDRWPELAPAHRAALLRWIAVKEVLEGRPGAAMATAREARALQTERDRELPYLPYLPSLVALSAPGPDPRFELEVEHIADAGRERFERRFWRLMLRAGAPLLAQTYRREQHGAMYVAALRGDGEALARSLGPEQDWEEGDVIAVLPRLETGREAVARQIAWLTPVRYEHAAGSVWMLALHAATRRDMMKLAGLTEEAARWAEIFRRFDAALGDRRRLVALMLWDG